MAVTIATNISLDNLSEIAIETSRAVSADKIMHIS